VGQIGRKVMSAPPLIHSQSMPNASPSTHAAVIVLQDVYDKRCCNDTSR
jgi:hypothetical protein